MPHAPILDLLEPAATDPALAGAKAAALARAAAAGFPIVPGFVLTTAWSPTDVGAAQAAYDELSDGGRTPVVVRSSSTVEDGAHSSMAGLFLSVLDVRSWAEVTTAVDAVLASRCRPEGPPRPMAVLVQRQLEPIRSGVLFGADPVSGRLDRLVVSSVEGRPDGLVSGTDDGWTAVLSRHGRVLDVRRDLRGRPSRRQLQALAGTARRAAELFGGPQDIEWAAEGDRVLLLQSRPITTLHGPVAGPVLGAGPLTETFPEPLTRLEQDLWVDPLREGLREALTLAGAASAADLRRSPVVTVVGGRPVADLEVLGIHTTRRFLRPIDPRPPARRVRAAWRVGRLSVALPTIAGDLVAQVDGDLADVPPMDGLTGRDLVAVLDNGREALRALHGYEALAGMLLPAGATAITAASLALTAIAEAGEQAAECEDLVAREPVVLALIPPRIGPLQLPGIPDPVAPLPAPARDAHPLAIAREALRLRARWVQELMARAAWALGERAAAAGLLPDPAAVRVLTLEELRAAALGRTAPDDLAERITTTTVPAVLPLRFRLAADGTPTALPTSGAGPAIGAGGGVSRGPVHLGTTPEVGDVLVVEHLDPRLAPVLPRLAGLVSETGSPLSHLAILAREFGVPTVVGCPDAIRRFPAGELVEVDGSAGTVELLSKLAGTRGER